MKHLITISILAAFFLILGNELTIINCLMAITASGLVILVLARSKFIDNNFFYYFSFRFFKYVIWLVKEIILSALKIGKIIWQQAPIQPSFSEIKCKTSGVEAIVLANSITMTPGTITVKVSENGLLVHSLTDETKQDIESGAMLRRIKKVTK